MLLITVPQASFSHLWKMYFQIISVHVCVVLNLGTLFVFGTSIKYKKIKKETANVRLRGIEWIFLLWARKGNSVSYFLSERNGIKYIVLYVSEEATDTISKLNYISQYLLN